MRSEIYEMKNGYVLVLYYDGQKMYKAFDDMQSLKAELSFAEEKMSELQKYLDTWTRLKGV